MERKYSCWAWMKFRFQDMTGNIYNKCTLVCSLILKEVPNICRTVSKTLLGNCACYEVTPIPTVMNTTESSACYRITSTVETNTSQLSLQKADHSLPLSSSHQLPSLLLLLQSSISRWRNGTFDLRLEWKRDFGIAGRRLGRSVMLARVKSGHGCRLEECSMHRGTHTVAPSDASMPPWMSVSSLSPTMRHCHGCTPR
jgi:hypothetical protein